APGAFAAATLDQAEAAAFRQQQVEDGEPPSLLVLDQPLGRLGLAFGSPYDVEGTRDFQQVPQGTSHVLRILDDEHRHVGHTKVPTPTEKPQTLRRTFDVNRTDQLSRKSLQLR